MAAVYMPHSHMDQVHVAPRDHHNQMCSSVAYSVAEAALEPSPTSPSYNQRPALPTMRGSAPLRDVLVDHNMSHNTLASGWHQPQKERRASSFGGDRSRPLWEVVEHARERRERQQTMPELPVRSSTTPPVIRRILSQQNVMADPEFIQELMLTTRSADPSPTESAFLLQDTNNNLPRLSARDFAMNAEKTAATTAHTRTQSDIHQTPSQVLRSQASARFRPRLPSLAQIHAKVSRDQLRSDSLDSQDSEGPSTPTEEAGGFDIYHRQPCTPPSPLRDSRLAPFLRERTHGRLNGRPKSVPTMSSDLMEELDEQIQTPPMFTTPPRLNTTNLSRRLAAAALRRGSDVQLVVTPPKAIKTDTPCSPTESVLSTASSVPSLPIITCTPAAEPDSDEESEGDVIVFNGEVEAIEDEEEEERREREMRGREMLSRLLRRKP
ncbi:hypothetical protein A1Q2_07509 [Trichosporon asahii var. asahii CBS 8904]|uniref:Uncharacterized protein n=1 Tax=Trichosporon asahii var. asahii (strain CBS 8904) TaxID=1220162 RepID=K1VNE3_TRIAC|nr:hypothetical protein A1Q2_07509 [Trichosporon asahii var. asahii CBS 8904]